MGQQQVSTLKLPTMKKILSAILAGILLSSCSHKQPEVVPPPSTPAPTADEDKRYEEEVRERAARYEEVRRWHQERENRASKIGVVVHDTETGKSYVVTRKPRQISHRNNHELYVMQQLAERDAINRMTGGSTTQSSTSTTRVYSGDASELNAIHRSPEREAINQMTRGEIRVRNEPDSIWSALFGQVQ